MNQLNCTALSILECLHSKQAMLNRPQKTRATLAVEIFEDDKLKVCAAYERIRSACQYLLKLGWAVQGPTQTTFYLSGEHYRPRQANVR